MLYVTRLSAPVAATLRSFSELPLVQRTAVRWQSKCNSRHCNIIIISTLTLATKKISTLFLDLYNKLSTFSVASAATN